MTLETIAVEATRQVPALGLFVVVIWLLLKHLKERDNVLGVISDRCHQNAQTMLDKATDNTGLMMEVVRENSVTLGKVHTVLDRINGES